MNLTQTSQTFKLGLKVFGVIVVVYYITTLWLIPTGRKIYRMIIRPLDPPNTAFGQLDQLEFVQKELQTPAQRYVLNTKNGALPDDFPVKMQVYKIKRPAQSYLSSEKAIADADLLGYQEKDLISDLKSNVYKWRNSQTGGTLEINKDTGVIKLETKLNSTLDKKLTKDLSESLAEKRAKDMFGTLERFSAQYDKGTSSVTLGKFSGNRVNQAITKIDGQVAQVSFYRYIQPAGNKKYKVVGPDPYKGLLYAVVGNGAKKNPLGFLSLEAYYKEITLDSDATYPIIEVQTAWEAVRAGRGVIAGIKPANQSPFETYSPVPIDTILINNVSLSYYESTRYQPYLQPIFVFEGKYGAKTSSGATNNGDIIIYFPAVSGEYVRK